MQLAAISDIGSSGDERRDGEAVSAMGIVTYRRTLKTKKGDRMAFVTIEDKRASCELIFFPDTFASFEPLTGVGEMIAVFGKLNVRSDEGAKIIVNFCESADSFTDKLSARKLYIKLRSDDKERISLVSTAAKSFVTATAQTPLVIFFEDIRKMTSIKAAPKIELSYKSLAALVEAAGEGNVMFEKKKG